MAVYSYLEGQQIRLIVTGWSCWDVHQGRHIRVVYMGIKKRVSHSEKRVSHPCIYQSITAVVAALFV
jgi:hypothetical protein